MPKHGKKYLDAAKLIDKEKYYPVEEAVQLVKKACYAKFDATVEVVFRLNVDPRHADQQLRGAMVLPNGTGKSQRVLVITQGAKVEVIDLYKLDRFTGCVSCFGCMLPDTLGHCVCADGLTETLEK
ncbi:MAG: hypothetical protein J5694_03480, partial [Erysipelotrichaceae bacterium]|nr:hypothetical protein [Erysipelotrichaceae bacterium]